MYGMYTLSEETPTALQLTRAMDIQLVTKVETFPEYNRIIRWGITAKGPKAYRTINKAHAIYKANNKHLSRVLLAHYGLPTPRLGADIFPCIGRPFSHSKGQDFFWCRTTDDVREAFLQGARYFSTFYPKTREYRVHIGGKNLLAIAEKQGENTSEKNWNYDRGFIFKYLYRKEYDYEIVQLAKKALQVLGLDFGAVDIMAYPTNFHLPTAVICEVNTAPSLTNYSLNKYVEYLLGKMSCY